jgi:hypothetical protein
MCFAGPRRLFWLISLCFALSANSSRVHALPAQLLLTNVPAYGSAVSLSGLVLNAAPAGNAVAVFIYVPGYGWVSKPTCAQPLTPIQADGSWTANITTAASDAQATRIAALVVSTNYNLPCVQGAAYLPTNIFDRALASSVVTRGANPTTTWARFSGYQWWLKSSGGLVGPGPNYFSSGSNNVWVDALGQLHLRITNRTNHWECAEIVSARTFGYGSYRFELNSPVNRLNSNVVLGLFTWSDDPAFAHRELDVECSRWANLNDPNNSQFVVQPYNLPGHLVRFGVPSTATNVTACFTWETNRVTFQCLRGSYNPNPAPADIISTWTYSLDVPRSGDENVRINLWLFNGQPPSDNQEPEFIIKNFRFVPAGVALPPNLTAPTLTQTGQAQFRIWSTPDRWLDIESSADLINWESQATMLASNTFTDFVDSLSPTNKQRFYRAIARP